MSRFALLLVVFGLLAAPAQARDIVMFGNIDDDPFAEIAERVDSLGLHVDQRYRLAMRGFAAELSTLQLAALQSDPEIAGIYPDRQVHAFGAVAAQAGTEFEPGVQRTTRAPDGQLRQGSGVSVAVLDSGIDLGHPDLNAVAGVNCAGLGAPTDGEGHGTHVAGTIAARDNGRAMAGVAPGTRVVAVKVLDDAGLGTTVSVLCGIEWVLANKDALNIRVANFSLGGAGRRSDCVDPEHIGYCRLADAGITPVVAAGNEGIDLGAEPPVTPAAYPEVLTVAATADTDGRPGGAGEAPCDDREADDRYASFSNFATSAGDAAHLIAAPGVCVGSTVPGGGTGGMSGTSQASPHVAGLVALCIDEAGTPGPCATLAPRDIIRLMVEQGAADGANGYTGAAGRSYGPHAVLPGTGALPSRGGGDSGSGGGNGPGAGAGSGNGDATSAAALRPRLVIKRTTLRTLLRRGIQVRVVCPARCAYTVRAALTRGTSRRLHVRRALGKRASSTGSPVVLRVSKRAKRALRRTRRAVVRIEATVGAGKSAQKLRQTVTLKR